VSAAAPPAADTNAPPATAPATRRALFDGKSLAGWRPIGKGEWRVEDGAIVGRHAKAEKDYGHLLSEESFTDFTIRLQFKAVRGNSGLYFRIAEKGSSGVTGFQAEIDAKVDVGGLYETNGRSWVVQPKPADVAKYFKPGEWNEMVVCAHGTKVTVDVNGVRTADIDDARQRMAGPFALQVHGGQDGEVWFKDIEIRP